VGVSMFVSTQTFRSNGGLNKATRKNSTSLILFVTKDLSELKQIAEAFSGETAVGKFMNLYEAATEGGHNFLFVDLHHKKQIQASAFKRNFDSYLLPDDSEKHK